MMKKLIVIIGIICCLKTGAQSLAPVSTDKFTDATLIFTDTVHNNLIASSKGSKKVGSLDIRGIARWNGIKWDSLTGGINTHNKDFQPFPNGIAACGTEFGGKLLVGGFFTSMGYVNSTGLALWDGIKWDSLPKRPFRFGQSVVVSNFLKKDGKLYIAGNFDTIAGQPTDGLATWDGMNYNPITLPTGTLSGSSFTGICSIVEYHGEIYIAGGPFNVGPLGNTGDVFKYNGTSWVSTTGTGFTGYQGVNKLIVYNDELYGCGYMLKSSGNPGNYVIKWNGSSWIDVGFGSVPYFINFQQMLVYHGKLWVFGTFDKVAGMSASNIAIYDGVNWCTLPDTISNQLTGATIYRDTIYVSGYFKNVNSDTNMAYIAKVKYPNLYSNCVNVGVNGLDYVINFNISPNPSHSIINITSEHFNLQNSRVSITNTIGQIVFSSNYMPQIDLSSLSAGMYYLTLSDGLKTKTVKVVKE